MKTPQFTHNVRMTGRRPCSGQASWKVAAAVISAVLLASCAAHGAGHPGHVAAKGGAGERNVVTLSSNGQAWTLTAKIVAVRSAGAWQRINSPVVPAAGNSVVVRGKLVLVASVTGMTLTLAISRDGGGRWATSKARLGMPTTGASISLSPDARHWIVGPAGSASAGSASQYTEGFVNTTAGGLAKVSVPGPVANLAWSGSGLVVPGGPADSHLYLSTDMGTSWQDVSRAVLGFTPPAANIPPAEPVFGPILGLSAGTAVVPVERVGPKGLSVHLEATTTGASYTRVGSANAAGDYGAGPLAMASSSYGPDKAALVLPGTMVLYVVASQGKPVMIHMSGLPVSPDSISFQSMADGIAQITVRSCASGKNDCTATVSQYVTSDGGRTWTPRRA
jgi:hypothetical protein